MQTNASPLLMRRWLLFAVSAVGALALPGAHARTFHVGPGGDDANPGTSGSPLRTMQKAAEIARAGDTVLVQGGVYRGHVFLRLSVRSNLFFGPGRTAIGEGPRDCTLSGNLEDKTRCSWIRIGSTSVCARVPRHSTPAARRAPERHPASAQPLRHEFAPPGTFRIDARCRLLVHRSGDRCGGGWSKSRLGGFLCVHTGQRSLVREVGRSGRSDGPFATVARARDAVRALLKTNEQPRSCVVLRGGTYYLDARWSSGRRIRERSKPRWFTRRHRARKWS